MPLLEKKQNLLHDSGRNVIFEYTDTNFLILAKIVDEKILNS